jgi:hypothetical protein
MKKLYIIAPIIVLLFAACSKRDYYVTPPPPDPRSWMRTHDEGVVMYVDYSTGNYIVETYNGYSVVEMWNNEPPIEYDREYAHFNNRGIQTIYNYDGNYFTEGKVVDSWLTWNEAMYLIDELKYRW